MSCTSVCLNGLRNTDEIKWIVLNFSSLTTVKFNKTCYRLFFLRSIAQFFYTNLHELFCQLINWTNWVNSGKFMDNCWISCQVKADMKKSYHDLIIINLYLIFLLWNSFQIQTHAAAHWHVVTQYCPVTI